MYPERCNNKGVLNIMGDARQYRINISAPNLVNVCIDNNENGDISGRMYCCYHEEPVLFSSVIDLIRKMENLFDAISFPQASLLN